MPLTRCADDERPTEVELPSGTSSRSTDWPCRDDSIKLRERKRRVKQPARRRVWAAAKSSNALDPGDIPLAAAQDQPAPMQKVGRSRHPLFVVDLGVVDGYAALGDRASRGAFALRQPAGDQQVDDP